MSKKILIPLVYAVLLVLSQLYLLVFPPLLDAPELIDVDLPREHLDLPEYKRNGTVTGNSVDLAYVDTGTTDPSNKKRDPVILIHGNPGTADNFAKMILPLARKFRVILPDLPGFGHSSHYVKDYSMKAQAHYILALMDELELKKAHLFGYSMGSGTAQYIYEIAPERVSSISIYGGIGVQEGEGSGDYHIEHFKYTLGYGAFVILPELVPHFGLLGPRYFRHSSIRAFLDSDQRPLRDIVSSVRTPFQIIHGLNDPLVPAWTAREHHRIASASELVMLDDSHFMPFDDQKAKQLVSIYTGFLDRHAQPRSKPVRITQDIKDPPPDLPVKLDLDTRGNPWSTLATIMAATFVSEDLTIISAGILAGDGRLDLFLAILGCFLGIFVGDLGLWILGALIGGPIRNFPLTKRIIPQERMAGWKEWFNQNGGKAVFLSRFVPGTRFITYLGAGLMGLSAGKFMLWAFIAGAIWSPLLVILSAIFGPLFARFFIALFGENLLAVVFALVFLFLFIRFFTMLFSLEGRARLIAMVQKFWRWEFWPAWLFNLPVVVHALYRGVLHGKPTIFTAANPGIPYGGLVGESKFDTLRQMSGAHVAKSALLDPHSVHVPEELGLAEDHKKINAIYESYIVEKMKEASLSFPVILKPDAAQRGAGVRKANELLDAIVYLKEVNYPTLVQEFHPGPHEAGVFYYRMPGQEHGKIFSITDKVFPVITGDGHATVRELIWRHPRYRLQGNVFMERHKNDQDHIPEAGEQIPLALAGNHCQGTMFLDGAHLITPELEKEIDSLMQSIDGFYTGRLDVRYKTHNGLKSGQEFQIIEVNGATSESTNIYDPSFSVFQAYGILFRQWKLTIAIARANQKKGARVAGFWETLGVVIRYYVGRKISSLSD